MAFAKHRRVLFLIVVSIVVAQNGALVCMLFAACNLETPVAVSFQYVYVTVCLFDVRSARLWW
jgi:uncharacterized integral membrane protein